MTTGADSKSLNTKLSLCLRIKIYLNNKFKDLRFNLQFKDTNLSQQFIEMNLLLNNFIKVKTNLKIKCYKIKDKITKIKH